MDRMPVPDTDDVIARWQRGGPIGAESIDVLVAEVKQLWEMHERDLIQVSEAHEARRKAEVEVERLREDREHLAHFIENIADQGFQVTRPDDGPWFVVT